MAAGQQEVRENRKQERVSDVIQKATELAAEARETVDDLVGLLRSYSERCEGDDQ